MRIIHLTFTNAKLHIYKTLRLTLQMQLIYAKHFFCNIFFNNAKIIYLIYEEEV